MPVDFPARLMEAIGVRAASFYGLSERTAFIEYDVEDQVWRPNALYGVTEVCDGRIVATGFLNNAMPLVRYNTEDAVSIDGCGRIVGIEGRWKHASLLGRSGGDVSMTALNLHSPEFAEMGDFQLVQSEPGEVKLTFLVSGNRNAAINIARAFTEKCAGEINFTATPVDDFILTKIGKRPLVIKSL
jgi:phenylacetate-CoA ligase